jgi:hypothetical protein
MARLPTITFVVALLMVIIAAGSTFGRNDEDVSVYCYLGTVQHYEVAGTVFVFYPIKDAVNLCNTTVYDCDSQCWACWTKSDGSEVCEDSSGRQFNR